MSDLTGNYYEPDFEDLSRVMKDVYNNYEKYKQKAISDSEEIRKKFNWENIGKIGNKVLNNFMEKYNSPNYQSPKIKNRVIVSYDGGPKVEILGPEEKEYKVEFCNNDEVIYNDAITNNVLKNFQLDLVNYDNLLIRELFDNAVVNLSKLNVNIIRQLNRIIKKKIIIISCHHNDFWKKSKILSKFRLVKRKKFIDEKLGYFITVNIFVKKS